MKNAHLIAKAYNRPLLLDPAYGRIFFAALSQKTGIEIDAPEFEGAGFDGNQRANGAPYRVLNGIALVPVTGTLVNNLGQLRPYSGMTGYDGIQQNIAMANEDPTVKGIMLVVDSPGGEVSGVVDTADAIRASQKPVWAHANEMAASAGYWLASAAQKVMLTRTSVVGSIGVLIVHYDQSKAMEDAGVKATMIYSGTHKVDGNPFEALPASVAQQYQQEADSLRLMFVNAVAGFRAQDPNLFFDTEAAIYRGQSAVTQKLADVVMPFSQAMTEFSNYLSQSRRGVSPKGVAMSDQTAKADMVSAEESLRLAESERAKGYAEGAKHERERISAILGSEQAKGREAQAKQLALATDMTAEQAAALLATMPSATEVAIADAAGVQAEAQSESTASAVASRIASIANKL